MKENSAAIHVQVPVDVAAFLLNEKRGEILKIETRHRVTAVLIPNKHLETPHYKLERIKHDDPRLDDLQASYRMAEEADTDIGYSKRKAEEAKPRQEAMVKGITPDRPAPIVERKPESVAATATDEAAAEGFLSRLFGLFRKKSSAPAEPETAKPAVRERSERGDRGGRNRRGRGRGRDRDERSAEAKPAKEVAPKVAKEAKDTKEPRQPKQAREAREPREAQEAGENRRERPPRPPRGERKPASDQPVPQAELPLTANAEPGDQLTPQVEGVAAEGGDDQPRRRRRRGGRNRNRRDRDQVTGEAGGNDVAESVDERDEGVEAGSHDHGHAHEANEAREAQEAHAARETHDTHDNHASPQPPAAPAPVVAAVATVTETVQQPVSAVSTPAFEAPVVEAPAVAQVAVAHAPTAEPVAQVDHVAQEDHVAHVAEVVQVAPPAAVVVPPSAPTPAPAAAASIDMDAILHAAGLQMTETNPERLRVVQAEQSATTPAPRAPRERKPLPTVADEPLQQVETRN